MSSTRSSVIYAFSLISVGLVVVYVIWIAILWRFQERIVFQPPAGVASSRVPARQVHYTASDGVDLFAYIVGDCTADGAVLLAFHGNADISRCLVPWATAVVRETGTCVVLPEYRGYDGLAGRPTYDGSARDARAALGYLRETLGASPANTVYFGHSLGTAIAAELAASYPPRALVLQSPFSSAREMASRMIVPGLTTLWTFISRVHFDTIARVHALACPVWVTHGDKDLIIPVRMGRDVFAAAAHKGELLIVPGAAHNDVPDVGGTKYWNWLRRSLRDETSARATPGAPEERRSAP